MPIYALTYHKLAQTSYFHSAEELSTDDVAVVALDQGQVLGRVVSGPHKDLDDVEEGVLGQVVRRVTPEDLAKEEENRSFGREAGVFWKACVARRSLEMKLVDVEVFLDRTKLIFYFTAQSRIDFRELVKDLVHEYRLRIEFRQIGVRHETQMIGAVGNCGMVCCCRRYLHQFAPVTIRMAKEQDLFLNPSKVSGICGRLLCCLAYEQENYEKFHNASPRPGKRYATARGHFKVVRSNMFQNSVTCLAEGGEEVRFSLEEWNAMNPVKLESGPRDSTEHYKSPLQCYGDEYDGEFPEDDVPEHRKARPSRQKPQKQTFVTGRVSYRQQGRGQESWKRSAGLVPPLSAQSSRPEQPAGQGQSSTQARAKDRISLHSLQPMSPGQGQGRVPRQMRRGRPLPPLRRSPICRRMPLILPPLIFPPHTLLPASRGKGSSQGPGRPGLRKNGRSGVALSTPRSRPFARKDRPGSHARGMRAKGTCASSGSQGMRGIPGARAGIVASAGASTGRGMWTRCAKIAKTVTRVPARIALQGKREIRKGPEQSCHAFFSGKIPLRSCAGI